MFKNRVDLKELSQELSQNINENFDWLNREISYVIDGSYDSEQLKKDIINLYDITKISRGKRGNNLIAKIGLFYITKYFGVDFNQALKIYNYLSNEDKLSFTNIVLENLDYYMKSLEA